MIIANEPNHSKEWGGQINPKEYASYLKLFSEKLKESGIKHSLIREPDAPYHNAAMAIGIAPCHRYLVKPYLSSFKLIK